MTGARFPVRPSPPNVGRAANGCDEPCNEEPTKPVPVAKVDLEYTVAAKTEGVEGKIKLKLIVAADGSVSDVEVLQSVEAAGPGPQVDDPVGPKELPGDRDGDGAGREDLRPEGFQGSRKALAVLRRLPEADVRIQRDEAGAVGRRRQAAGGYRARQLRICGICRGGSMTG